MTSSTIITPRAAPPFSHPGPALSPTCAGGNHPHPLKCLRVCQHEYKHMCPVSMCLAQGSGKPQHLSPPVNKCFWCILVQHCENLLAQKCWVAWGAAEPEPPVTLERQPGDPDGVGPGKQRHLPYHVSLEDTGSEVGAPLQPLPTHQTPTAEGGLLRV